MTKDLFDLLIRDYWENVQKLDSLAALTGAEHWFQALSHFKDYAYERNIPGAASRYRAIAKTALTDLKWSIPTSDLETDVWNRFQNECKKEKIKPNIRVNPLKVSDGERVGLVRFVKHISDTSDKTVAAWAFRMISENGVEEAHTKLKTVWGVGDKIASFYLRDIFWLGHQLDPKVTVKNDYFLQPIDLWVERASNALGHEQKSKLSVAKRISSFEKENGIAHGGGNIGFWMLGSSYVNDPDQFKDVVKAIANQGSGTSSALSIARRFEDFHGKFGAILKDIIRHNESIEPTL